MSKKILFIFVIASLILAACATAGRDFVAESPAELEYAAEEMVASNAVFSQSVAPTTERMVIKDVQISMAVDDPEASAQRIKEMAEAMGGYVVTLRMYQTTLENGVKVPQGTIAVRVPAERLNEALEMIKAETKQPILSENADSQDVTAAYTDLGSKLRNLEAAEKQLQQIMDAATKTEDVLRVYGQLVSTREQIELIKGQMQYYAQAAALSSVSVELFANEAIQPLSIGSWQPKGVAKEAVQTLINTLKWLADAAIWIVLYILPTAICIFGPLVLVYLGIRRVIRKYKKDKVASPPQES